MEDFVGRRRLLVPALLVEQHEGHPGRDRDRRYENRRGGRDVARALQSERREATVERPAIGRHESRSGTGAAIRGRVRPADGTGSASDEPAVAPRRSTVPIGPGPDPRGTAETDDRARPAR